MNSFISPLNTYFDVSEYKNALTHISFEVSNTSTICIIQNYVIHKDPEMKTTKMQD